MMRRAAQGVLAVMLAMASVAVQGNSLPVVTDINGDHSVDVRARHVAPAAPTILPSSHTERHVFCLTPNAPPTMA